MHRTRTLLLLLAAACAPPQDVDAQPTPDDTAGPSPYTHDDVLRLNHVQALGTHNSYHQRSTPTLDASWAYDQPTLTDQLALHGVRQFELDVHLSEADGWQVFHIPNVDAGTSCRQFADCLAEIETWSDAHPWHLPIVIWIEPKDEEVDAFVPGLLPIAGQWDAFDAFLRETLPDGEIITPDEVRGDAPDLATAIAERGWPTLGSLRGRLLFSMLDSSAHRAEYLSGHPTLQGRAMFATADATTDAWSAVFKINDAVRDGASIAAALAQGFVTTSNVDGAASSDADNASSLAGALASGTHFLSSDFPGGAPDRAYDAAIPDGAPARCNPITAPPDCTAADVEALASP
ncbi:MAG: hypothetical protein RLZZ383_2978 [Pseudomonadota bacterium]|jgi:hypothetical protein